MASLHQRRAVFVGLARDCASHLLHVLDNVYLAAHLFDQAAFLFAENDSTDSTPQILKAFCSSQPRCSILNFDRAAKKLPERTRRLAYLRNSCLSAIRADKVLRIYDYLIVVDMDNSNVMPLDAGTLARAFDFLEGRSDVAGVFPNCRGIYYDMWALREETHCPVDVWEEQLEYVAKHQVDDMTAFQKVFVPRLFTIPETAAPIAVSSAFGGLGIYKMRYALNATYMGHKSKYLIQEGKEHRIRLQVCEHVHFNQGITRQGVKLYILPFFVNRTTRGIEFSESAYRSLIF